MDYKKQLNKKDVITGYLARGISMSFGIITLPMILHLLSEGEIALNYVMQTLMSIVILFDMGFSQQFARSFAYVFGGAQELTEKGVPSKTSDFVNYELLYKLTKAAQKFYRYMSAVVLVLLLTFGTWYIYHFTNGFTLVDNVLYLWIFFSCSIVFDFYFKYYGPLLIGKGMISELNKIELYTTLVRVAVLVTLLLLGCGLWSLVISNFTRLVIVRIYSVHCFYSAEIKSEFGKLKHLVYNEWELLKILWFNAKKKLVVSITTYVGSQLGLFLTGIYLTKADTASYGLLLQFINIISALSLNVNNSTVGIFSSLRAQGDVEKLKENFFFSMGVCYYFFILGGIGLFFIVPPALVLIKSNASLPALSIMIITFVYKLLENQHVICSTYATTKNVIVDFESSTILGIVAVLLLWGVFEFTSLGVLGIVLTQLLLGLSYPNWKWPYEVCKEFKISYPQFVYSAFSYTNKRISRAVFKK